MKITFALSALSALAQETRLAAFRLLVRQGPDGLAAGVIARKLHVAPSTLSAHLAQLTRARLIRSQRVQRQIIYSADYAGIQRLLDFLMEDCCAGRSKLRAAASAQSKRNRKYETPTHTYRG